MKYLTAGESHGKALVGILEGLPAGLEISKEDLQVQLQRRKLGYGRGDRQKIETDAVEILSGIRFGKTLGSPISLVIENKDWAQWKTIMSLHKEDETSERKVEIPRPGHADLTGKIKYQFEDMRNVLERASARETTMRVAVASCARVFLKACGIDIYSRVVSIGEVQDATQITNWSSDLQNKIDCSPVRMSSTAAEEKSISNIQKIQDEGNTLGGMFEVVVTGLPPGLGSYVHWDRKIDGRLSQAFMSLNAIKAVEIGDGFASAYKKGSEVHDSIVLKNESVTLDSNRSGGLAAGMTTGQNLCIRAAMKPLSTLKASLPSVHLETLQPSLAHFERSDVCAVPAAAVIGESLAALVLAEELLIKFGGDSMAELLPRLHSWKKNHG